MFQAYSTYWPDGYTAQYAWAAAWMCKYDPSACPEAVATFNGELSMHTTHFLEAISFEWILSSLGVFATCLLHLSVLGMLQVHRPLVQSANMNLHKHT